MKKLSVILVILIFVLTSCTTSKPSSNITIATWVSYIDYTQILWGKNINEYTSEVENIVNNCVDNDINTIYLHFSAFTDAYYPSKYYPSQYITSEIGSEFDFDPMEIFISIARRNDIRVEAWINPYRSFSIEKMETVPSEYIIKKWADEGNNALILYKDNYYLNPSNKDAQKLVKDVIKEILGNYKVSGIHFDDYFYPDKVTEEFDDTDYQKAKTNQSLSDWRRNNVNGFVSDVYKLVKSYDKNLVFGISPSGNLEYTTNTIYGDPKAWVKDKSVDYLAPQLYFGYTNTSLSYLDALEDWNSVVEGSKVGLIVGLSAYKINQDLPNSDKEEWNSDDSILAKQVDDAKKSKNYKGYALYSYHAMFRDNSLAETEIIEQLKKINSK